MVYESLAKLRLDRRLLHRRNWISEEELKQELESLPDVSDKMAPPEPEEGDSASDNPEKSGGAS